MTVAFTGAFCAVSFGRCFTLLELFPSGFSFVVFPVSGSGFSHVYSTCVFPLWFFHSDQPPRVCSVLSSCHNPTDLRMGPAVGLCDVCCQLVTRFPPWVLLAMISLVRLFMIVRCGLVFALAVSVFNGAVPSYCLLFDSNLFGKKTAGGAVPCPQAVRDLFTTSPV